MGGNGATSRMGQMATAWAQHHGGTKANASVVIRQMVNNALANAQQAGVTMSRRQAITLTAQSMQQAGVNLPASVIPQAQQPTLTNASQNWQNFQKMDGSQVATYLKGLSNVQMPYSLAKNDTQRIVYDLGLNDKPQVVTSKDFDKISGTTYYRGVKSNVDSKGVVLDTAFDVANKTLLGKYTSIGSGMYGNGFYFTDSRSTARGYAGGGSGLNNSVIMRMKIDPSKARIVEYSRLNAMFHREPQPGQV